MKHALGGLLIGSTIVAIGACSESTPPPPPVATVRVTIGSDSVLVGDSLQLTATTLDAQRRVLTGRTVTWASSDTTIAKVSAVGQVHGVSAGAVTITASSEGIAGTAPLGVRQRLPSAPQNLQVSAGTRYNELVIAWTNVPGATCYSVYWGTSPGVTTQTGTKIDVCHPDGILGRLTFRHDSLTSHTTYYYIVTAVNDVGEGLPSSEAHATASGDIAMTTIMPSQGDFSDTLLDILVKLTSRFQLDAVVAQVAGHAINLVFVADTLLPSGLPGADWTGRLPLSGLPQGPKVLSITASDVFADTARQFVNFVYDQVPRLVVTAPIDYTVARPDIHVTATCTDDGATGCTLTIRPCEYYVGAQGYCLPPVATVQGSIDQTVSLASCEACDHLEFTATDSAGRQTTAVRQVYVESSPLLTEVASVTGEILDARPDRLLWVDRSTGAAVLTIRDRVSGNDVTIPTPQPVRYYAPAFLTPSGALFEASTAQGTVLYDWEDGSLTNFGMVGESHTLAVKDSFALWNAGQTLVRRDLNAGVNLTVSDSAALSDNDVANNGDVVYWTQSGQIYRVRNGTTTRLAFDSTLEDINPTTDGINVAYLKVASTMANSEYQVAVYDSVEHVLTPPDFSNRRDYRTVNGWVAYSKGSGSETQVWTRSPGGQETQATRFGFFQSLGPNGEVVVVSAFAGAFRRYLAIPDYSAPMRDIGSFHGTPFFLNGTLFIRLGRSLFQVNP